MALYRKFRWSQWVLWDQIDCRLFKLLVRKILLGEDLDKKEIAS